MKYFELRSYLKDKLLYAQKQGYIEVTEWKNLLDFLTFSLRDKIK